MGYQKVYSKDLCTGTNNDTVAPQVKPNGRSETQPSRMHWTIVHIYYDHSIVLPLGLLQTLKTYANVSVTFVGHNHGNDWCCPHPAGLYICYARHTGYGGYGT